MAPLMQALRAGHWPSLFGAWLHFEVSFVVWLLVGALGVLIAQEFGLNASEKGLLVAVPLLGGALLRIGIGLCTDRFGAKRTGMGLLIGQALAVLWGWLGATTYMQVLGVGLLLGVAGASFAVALPLASRAYPPAHQGFAMGVAASGNSGVVLAAFFAPRLGEVIGWHGVFGVMLIPLGLTALAFARVVRADLGAAGSEERWSTLMGRGLRQPSMYWLCFLYAVTFGGFVGLSSFLPIYLHDQYGLTPVTAGTITALCGLAGSVIRPVGGYVADRCGGLRVSRYLFPALCLLGVLVSQLPALYLAVPLLVISLGTMGFGNGVVFQIVSDHFPKQIGVASGIIGAAGGLGGFVLPSALGVLKDASGSYGAGFLLFSTLAATAWISIELARRRPKAGGGGLDGCVGLSH